MDLFPYSVRIFFHHSTCIASIKKLNLLNLNLSRLLIVYETIYGAPIRAKYFWICLLAQLKLFGFMCSSTSLGLCKPRLDIDAYLLQYYVVSVWNA